MLGYLLCIYKDSGLTSERIVCANALAPYFTTMEKDNVFTETLLRRIYKCTDQLPNIPTTTLDIKELLELHENYLTTYQVNELMSKIGFLSRPITDQADRLWLVVQEEIL